MEKLKLPYTLCFCLHNPTEQILMVKRSNRPNKNRYNALGGKLEEGENPWKGAFREVREEAQIDLTEASQVNFGGLVTWQVFDEGEVVTRSGMYVYVAHFSDNKILFSPRETREGLLTWLPREDVENGLNNEFADNIPYFTAPMLAGKKPMEYRCTYNVKVLTKVEKLDLPENLIYQ